MKMNHTAMALALATAFTVTAGIATPRGDKPIKLSGCLVRGEGGGAGYLLIGRAFDPATPSAGNSQVTPGTVGTTGGIANIFYWLDGDGDLKKHVGHRVEVDGETKGDVKDGEMKIDRKDNWTELSVKADGRTMRARVPNSSIVPGPDPKRRMDVIVRRIDVDHVRMLAADCQ